MLIGVPDMTVDDNDYSGYVGVVYGHANNFYDVDMLHINETIGMKYLGPSSFYGLGWWMSVGDVNNDTVPDVVISSYHAEINKRVAAGVIDIVMRGM